MNIYIYGFQYGTFSAIVLGGQLQKNVWAMFGVFLGESPHFLAGFWQVFGASFPAASSKTIVCLKKSLQYMFRSFSANFSVTIVLIKHKCFPMFLAICFSKKTWKQKKSIFLAIKTTVHFQHVSSQSQLQTSITATQVFPFFAADFPATSPPKNIT